MTAASDARDAAHSSARLWFGLVAALILLVGLVGLPGIVPGYSHVRQTVSEIGEIGSPARVAFAAMLCAVAACLLIFAAAVLDLSKARGHSAWSAVVLAFMA